MTIIAWQSKKPWRKSGQGFFLMDRIGEGSWGNRKTLAFLAIFPSPGGSSNSRTDSLSRTPRASKSVRSTAGLRAAQGTPAS
jgi:hypothetical protein